MFFAVCLRHVTRSDLCFVRRRLTLFHFPLVHLCNKTNDILYFLLRVHLSQIVLVTIECIIVIIVDKGRWRKYVGIHVNIGWWWQKNCSNYRFWLKICWPTQLHECCREKERIERKVIIMPWDTRNLSGRKNTVQPRASELRLTLLAAFQPSLLPKSFLKWRYFSCIMILSTGIRCSCPDSIILLLSPRTTVHSAGRGKLNKSLWKIEKF